jgi:integral membrane protein (TIGR00529 family)
MPDCSFLLHVPAMVKIGVIFAGLLIALRLRVTLELALLAGGFLLDLWSGRTLGQTFLDFAGGFADTELWMLLLMTLQIVEVGRFMTERENADELQGITIRLGGRHGRIVSLMALPAVIGLVPMPAGARFSAPFVEQMAGGRDAAWKTTVNYWFRHLWEYWWPLYPGVMLAATLFSMDVSRFTATLFLFTPCSILTGYFLLVRPHRRTLQVDTTTLPPSRGRQAITLAPLITVLAAVFLLPLLPGPWRTGGAALKLLPAILGLAMALLIIYTDELRRARRAGVARWRPPAFGSAVANRRSAGVFLALVGIMLFKHMLECSGLLKDAAGQLHAAHVPAMLAVMILPFVAALVTGVSVGFVGASFPFVVALLNAPNSTLTPLATLFLAYGSGFTGLLLSPVHLCLLLSREYFQAPFPQVYRLLTPPSLVILLIALAGYATFSWLGW